MSNPEQLEQDVFHVERAIDILGRHTGLPIQAREQAELTLIRISEELGTEARDARFDRERQARQAAKSVFAYSAIKAFLIERGLEGEIEDQRHSDGAVKSLLCDLRHYCDVHSIDWSNALEVAEEYYEEEMGR